MTIPLVALFLSGALCVAYIVWVACQWWNDLVDELAEQRKDDEESR